MRYGGESTLFHSIIMPDNNTKNGILPTTFLQNYLNLAEIPDVKGKKVADLGCANGFYTLELAKQGAEVWALEIDEVHFNDLIENLDAYELSNVHPYNISVYDMDELLDQQEFDIILMMGLIYHLRHPLLALDIVCPKFTELLIIESYFHRLNEVSGYMKFFPHAELNDDPTNWWGPDIDCLQEMMKSAGCTHTQIVNVYESRIIVHGSKLQK